MGTGAWQLLLATALVPAGQVIEGGVLSTTEKVVVHCAVLLDASLAVKVMVVWPADTRVPAVGDWVMVISPGDVQLSLAVVELTKLGTGTRQVAPAYACSGAGQTMVGAVTSFTVMVNVHWAVLSAPSVAVRVMVVVPKG